MGRSTGKLLTPDKHRAMGKRGAGQEEREQLGVLCTGKRCFAGASADLGWDKADPGSKVEFQPSLQ